MSNVQAQNPHHFNRFAPHVERALTLDWRPDDVDLAQHEGWDIFETGGGSHPDFEIERVDDDELFADDTAAAAHVVTRAAAGSATHLRAVAFLAVVGPEDLQAIFNEMFYGTYRTCLRPQR